MRHKALAATVAALALVFAAAAPASAVTDGTPDGEGHPYVGLMVAQDDEGNPLWRCSGTLISPTVYVTAGHCTFGAEHVELWFQSDLEPVPADFGYPYDGEVSGTAYTHPDYDDAAFYLADVGVVVLDTPVVLDQYGELPTLDQLDAFTKSGKKDATFTSVGYGLQKAFPDAASWKDEAYKTRMVAYPKLNQINAPGGPAGYYSLLLSNNAKTGGTCFGDSGGPNFIGTSNVLAGVTSYGLNSTCGGTGGVYRLDRAVALDWVSSFL